MDSTKMVSLTINDKKVEVPQHTSVIEAAEKAGAFVPRYCYHIDLSIAGVCRMCVVDIEKNPRLQIACNTTVAEGMVVRTDTPRVKEAVKSALELHLINHPLDCPICDKAGECKLQDFYSSFGLYQSRMDYDEKVHKPKVVDIGPIVLDSERCILCTRCVRFTAEVTQTNEFGIFNRGDRSELRTYDHGPLRNDYTGNLADICPVGALTAKDFRFQQRVWFLQKAKTVCTMCARGCNTLASVNPSTQKLYRVEPRRNPEVNKSWMCDVGRWGYHHVSDDKRIKTPRYHSDGKFTETTWDMAFQSMKEALESHSGKVLVALSPFLTNEECLDLVGSLGKLGVKDFTWVVDEKAVEEKAPYDGILKHRDLTPNARGLLAVMKAHAVSLKKTVEATAALAKKSYDWVFILGVEGHNHPGLAEFVKAVPAETKLVAHATSEAPFWERAQWVLPNVSSFEKNGTVINALGRIQKVQAALPPQLTSRGGHAVAFGVSQGNDRTALPELRAEQTFEAAIAPHFLGSKMKFRQFDVAGAQVEEAKLAKS